MGNNQANQGKQQSAAQIGSPQVPSNNDQEFQTFVAQTFQSVAQNGNITNIKFQEALTILENFNIIKLRDTPLGNRLFILFDKNKSGVIRVTEFLNAFNLMINDQEMRIKYTFQAYDKDGKGVVNQKDFVLMIEESWLSAFRFLGEMMNQQNKGLNITVFNNFATSNSNKLQAQAMNVFKKYDTRRQGYLDQQMFRQFVIDDEFPEIVATFENNSISIPLTLLSFKRKN